MLRGIGCRTAVTLGGGTLDRGALTIEAFGAGQPAFGHPVPGRPARRVAGELGHLLAIGSVAQEFLGWIHRLLPPGLRIILLWMLFGRGMSGWAGFAWRLA